MDKGISIENPYAHVSIPRAQLKDSFVRNYLGDDFSNPVIANPAVLPSYPTYMSQEQDNGGSPYQQSAGVGSGPTIRTQESWRRPYNPYASDKATNGSHPTEMYTIDLDKRNKDFMESEPDPGCCACCKCCPCCRKCCCVVS